jgi:hypothetical protein
MNERITVFDPTGLPSTARATLSPPLPSIIGKRIGLLDNSKPNADLVLEAIGEELRTTYGVTIAGSWRKPRSNALASDALRRELRDRCDAVITASAE